MRIVVAPSFDRRDARLRLRGGLLVLALLALTACKPDEDAAAEHYQRALSYVAEGDAARARVEFLNTLSRRPNHFEARLAYAALLQQSGALDAAYAQYTRAIEQVPDHLPTLLTLSELAMLSRDLDAAHRYTRRAAELAGGTEAVRARQAVLAYSDAVTREDPEARDRAIDLLLEHRDASAAFLPLHHALVDGFARRNQPEEALAALDYGLGLAPDDRVLLTARLQLLYQLDRKADIAPHFRRMIETFPESGPLRSELAGWHVANGDIDAAEAVLRDMPDPASTEAQLALVRFLAAHRGSAAALAELEELIGKDAEAGQYRLLRAAILHDTGERQAALDEVAAVIAARRAAKEPATEALFLQAQMLEETGQRPEAEAALRDLLSAAPRHVPAAQLLAAWLIERGQPDPAIHLLSAAQAVQPEEAQTLTLLARALSASGKRQLARRTAADAFRASGYAPEQALYYAFLLTETGNDAAAIEVLTTALARAPRHETLLATVGDYYRMSGEWDLAEEIEARLRDLGSTAAVLAAERMHFDRLVASSDMDIALRYLETRPGEGDVSALSFASIARSNLASGHVDRARRVLDLGLARFPGHRELRAAAAALALATGDYDRAAGIYKGLAAETPENEKLWVELLRIRQRQQDEAAVEAVLTAGLAANPGGGLLRWESALRRQSLGQNEEAIAIYRALLADHPDSAPVRNNLAALLSRGPEPDPAALRSAAEIAAPLAGSPVPQFLDTYGWIQFGLGQYEAAVGALRTAADALPENPEIRFHAGEALAAVGRRTEARAHYEAVLRLASGPTGPLAEQAQAALDRLPAVEGEGN